MPPATQIKVSSTAQAPNGATHRIRWYAAVTLALTILATCAVYLPAMNGALLWDDPAHITRPELQSFAGLYRIWFEVGATQQYYPLLHSAFWLEHMLWGDAVLGYHLVNVIWHVLAVTLLYLILERLKIPGALLAAAVFALHPVMVESVAWISEQKNTLSAVFYLGAMLAYLNFDKTRWRSHYLLACALFVLGLLTKTVTATLPAALLVIFWWQRGSLSWKRDVWPLVPLFVLGAAAGVLTALVERKLIGAEGANFDLSLLQRGLLACRVVWFYLSKLLWPLNLVFIYPRWEIDSAVWWQWLFPVATLTFLFVLWTLRRTARGPLAGWLFFCGTLFPVLGFLNVYPFLFSFTADHFQYLASLGIIVPLAGFMVLSLNRLPRLPRWVGASICLVLIGALALLTRHQSQMYADAVTLYRTTIDRNPNCWMAHNNLGMELASKNNHQAAIEHYRTAIRIRPEYIDAYINLGNALNSTGRLPEAIAELHAAIALKPDHPGVLNNLGMVLIRLGRNQEAIEHLEHALRFQPENASVHNNLGIARCNIGQLRPAIEDFRKAVELDPSFVDARKNLAVVLASNGDAADAIDEFQQVLQLQPDRADAHYGLAEQLRQTGRHPEAIEHYRAALRRQPDLVLCYANWAQSLASLNRPKEAVAIAKKGIDAARRDSQEEAAQQIEDWLKHYQMELQRNGDSTP